MRALIAGTLKHFPNGSFTLGNTAYTTSSLVALFQSVIDAIGAANAAKASAKDAVAAMRAVKAKVSPVALDYTRFLLATFRTATQDLADFGLEIKSRKPRTSEQNAAAAAKAKSTRTARGTMSKKKKLAIKGNVTGVVMTPVPPPASPAPGAQLVSTASSTANTASASK